MKIKEENRKRYMIVCYDMSPNTSCILAYGDTKQEALNEYIKETDSAIKRMTNNIETLKHEREQALAELEKCENC